MNPWVFIGITVLIIVISCILFSLVFTWLMLKLADRHARKIIDLHAKNVAALLPGTDCGKCGYESCYECARAIILSQESPNACKEGAGDLDVKVFAAVLEFQKLTKRDQDRKPAGRKRLPLD